MGLHDDGHERLLHGILWPAPASNTVWTEETLPATAGRKLGESGGPRRAPQPGPSTSTSTSRHRKSLIKIFVDFKADIGSLKQSVTNPT